jgi:hypothetical protein
MDTIPDNERLIQHVKAIGQTWWTIPELASLRGGSRTPFYKGVRSGRLQGEKKSDVWMFSEAAVIHFLSNWPSVGRPRTRDESDPFNGHEPGTPNHDTQGHPASQQRKNVHPCPGLRSPRANNTETLYRLEGNEFNAGMEVGAAKSSIEI